MAPLLSLGLALLLTSSSALAAPYHLIVCGSGGQAEYSRRFAQWGQRLQAVLAGPLQHPRTNIHLLTETQSLDHIEATLARLAQQLQAKDQLFIYLIGHGNFRDNTAKFNIPGPDLSARALGRMLQPIQAKHTVLINAASASAAFINALSATDRVLCTSTRSVEQRSATRFMEFFLQGLEGGSADQNRDGRISALEACRQGAALTQDYFDGAGLIATEHALIDDDGDGLGVRPALAENDGLAGRIYLQDIHPGASVPPQLIQAYKEALAQAEAFIGQKENFIPQEYYRQLEVLLVKAAQLNRQIRAQAEKAE